MQDYYEIENSTNEVSETAVKSIVGAEFLNAHVRIKQNHMAMIQADIGQSYHTISTSLPLSRSTTDQLVGVSGIRPI